MGVCTIGKPVALLGNFPCHPVLLSWVLYSTGYVEQFDTLLAELTVREMLMYTAELKRPVKVSHPLWSPSIRMVSYLSLDKPISNEVQHTFH